MAQVTVTLNGRKYRLTCGDGEEPRLLALAEHLSGHVERLAVEFGQVGSDRLLLMAALHIADELFDARAALASQRDEPEPAADAEAAPAASERRPRRARPAPKADVPSEADPPDEAEQRKSGTE